MKESHHIAVTKLVCEALEIDDNINILSKEAAFPDEVASIKVDGVGYHMFGQAFCSLVHFCKPVSRSGALANYQGYNWRMDKSIPFNPDLPDREVYATPDGWHVPFLVSAAEPLVVLLSELRQNGPKGKQRGCTSADDLTYPTAGAMADWLFKNWKLLGDGRANDVRYAGWICHFVQDCCIRHHARGVLLAGHSEYEAMLYEWWVKQSNAGKLTVEYVQDVIGKMPPISPRTLAYSAAQMSHNRSVAKAATEGTTKLIIRTTASALKGLYGIA
jgi:hypothetical protein